MPEKLPPHLEIGFLYPEERRRTLVSGIWSSIGLPIIAGIILKDVPRAFDGRVADTELQHGRSLMCQIHLTTTFGTERVRRFGAGPCAVLRPGLHITKAAWRLWIEGGSERVAVLSGDGSKLRPGQFHETLWSAQKKTGLRRIKWHELRHSFASIVTTGGAAANPGVAAGSLDDTDDGAPGALAPGESAGYMHLLATPRLRRLPGARPRAERAKSDPN
jgi:hypothetical protein